MLKIAFNAVPLLSPLTGIGQYAKSLLLELDADKNLLVDKFYAKGWSGDVRQEGLSSTASRLKNAVRRFVPNSYAMSRAVQQHFFKSGVRAFKPDLYHEPNFLAFKFNGPSVITVHDLSWIRYPEMHPLERVRAMEKYFEPGLRRATKIITDSEFVKNELVAVFGVRANQVHSISLGVDSTFRPLSARETIEVLRCHELSHGRYWLAVGTLEPRKNLQLVVRAFMRLTPSERQACPLVLIGIKGWKTDALDDQLQPLIRAGEIRRLGYVDRDDLAVLVAGAKALIYPSIYEGFGLPPLEAMACAVPVIVSDVSSLPEVVGDAGLRIDPADVDGLTQYMRQLLEDSDLCDRLGAAGLRRSKSFTWAKCAQDTVDVYKAAVT